MKLSDRFSSLKKRYRRITSSQCIYCLIFLLFPRLFPSFSLPVQHLCYICFKDKLSTQAAVEYSQHNNLFIGERKVSVRYADLSRVTIPPPEPECISETEDVVVPGLHLFTDFVSLEEEKELLEFSDQKDDNGRQFWKTNLHRRVQVLFSLFSSSLSPSFCVTDVLTFSSQHFGYEFNYSTLLLDRTANIRPIPSLVMKLMDSKLSDVGAFQEEVSSVNQLTINEYYPGQGISSHVGQSLLLPSFSFSLPLLKMRSLVSVLSFSSSLWDLTS
jgi:alkylated DNA repair protein alkB homolog 8